VAITTEKAITKKFINILGVQLIDIATGLTNVLRTPSKMTIDYGFGTKTTMGIDGLGREALIDRVVNKAMAELEIEFGGDSMELLALRMGRSVSLRTGDNVILPFRRQALAASSAAIPTGGLGFDLIADPVGIAGSAKLGNALSVALVQQPFATFIGATPLSFAVGVAGAMKFSDDLVAARAIMELQLPCTVDTRQISEQDLGFMRLRCVIRNSDDSVTLVDCPTIQVNPEGTKLDPSAENSTFKASILTLGGCEGVIIKELARRLTC
jgi:hypothetical protein